MRILLAITGASGAVYGTRTGELLVRSGAELHVLVSKTAWEILAAELPAAGALPETLSGRHEWLAAAMGVSVRDLGRLLADMEAAGLRVKGRPRVLDRPRVTAAGPTGRPKAARRSAGG